MFALDAMMHATPVTLGSRVMEAQLEGIRALEADRQCISLPEQTHAAERTFWGQCLHLFPSPLV